MMEDDIDALFRDDEDEDEDDVNAPALPLQFRDPFQAPGPGPARKRPRKSAPARREYGILQGALEAQRQQRRREEQAENIGGPGYQCPLCWLHIENPLTRAETKCLSTAYEVLHENIQNVALSEIYRTMADRWNGTVIKYHRSQGNVLNLQPWTPAAVRHHVEECSLEYRGIMRSIHEREHLYNAQEQLWRTRCFYVEPPAEDELLDEDPEPEPENRPQILDERSFDRFVKIGQRIDQLTRHIQSLLRELTGTAGTDPSKKNSSRRTIMNGPLKITPTAMDASQKLVQNVAQM